MEENSAQRRQLERKSGRSNLILAKERVYLSHRVLLCSGLIYGISFPAASIFDFTASLCKECKNRKVGVSAGSATVGV